MQSTVLLSLKSLDVPITWEPFKSTSAPSLGFCLYINSFNADMCMQARAHICARITVHRPTSVLVSLLIMWMDRPELLWRILRTYRISLRSFLLPFLRFILIILRIPLGLLSCSLHFSSHFLTFYLLLCLNSLYELKYMYFLLSPFLWGTGCYSAVYQ